MAVPLEQFVRQLDESGISLVSDLKDFLPPNAAPKDAEELARELVRRKKLTSFQAEQIYAGNGKSLVLGNYVILDKLGQGGMGMVLKAEHKRMKRVVALKVMSAAALKSPEAVMRFHREVEAAARLSHPNIVAAFDADEDRGTHFLVMEYVAGSDLAQLVKQQGPLPVARAIDYMTQAARGLEHAHQQGLIHRDIKPANLLLDQKGTVKILDMGLARFDDSLSSSEGAANAGLTTTGTIMGTVDYMSPEQALDTKHADARSDIYSLGVSLFYLLAGRVPFQGDTIMKKLLAHREDPIPSLCAIRPDIPADLDLICQKMLAKKPADRIQTMTEVITALQVCADGRGTSETVTLPAQPASGITTGNTEFHNFLKGLDQQTTNGRSATRSDTIASRTGQRATATLTEANPPTGRGPSTGRATVVSGGSVKTWIAMGLGAAVVVLGLLYLLIPGDDFRQPDSNTAEARVGTSSGSGTNEATSQEAALRGALDWLFSVGAQVSIERNVLVHSTAEALAAGKPVSSVAIDQRSIQDEDLAHLAALPELSILSLARCGVGDAGLIHVGRLRKLVWLDLTETKASDYGLRALTASRGLRTVTIRGPQMTTQALETIAQLSSLATLNWESMPVDAKSLRRLQRLKNLGHLNLGSCPDFDDDCAEAVAGISSLGSLWVMRSQIGAPGLKKLMALPNLQSLNLDGGQNVTDDCGAHFAAFPLLQNLNISHTQLGDRGLAELLKNSSINWLAQIGTPVTDASITAISSATQLASVDLQNTQFTAVGVKQLADAMPWCQIQSSHGTYQPRQQFSVPAGPGLAFDGQSYVEIPSLTWNGADPVTLEFVITPDANPMNETADVAVWTAQGMASEIRVSEWQASSWVMNRIHATGRQSSALDPVRPNERVILTCAWDGQKTGMWANGVPARFRQLETLPMAGSSGLLIGGRGQTGLQGMIDQIRVSKGVRTRLLSPPPGKLPNDEATLALYHFGEGGGDILVDSSGNNHHGKIVGAKWVTSEPSNRSADIINRRAAEWALKAGGTIRLQMSGQDRTITQLADLPAGAFDLISVDLRSGVKDADLRLLRGCTKLESVGLNGCFEVTDAGLAALKDLRRLGNVSLFGAQVTDDGLKHLARASNLSFVHLAQTRITDAGLEELAKHRNLSGVLLQGTKVTEIGVKKLAVSEPWCTITWDGGEIMPTAPIPQTAPPEHGLQFDGVSSHVEIPLFEFETHGPLTVEAWFTVEQKPPANNGDPDAHLHAVWSAVNPRTKALFHFLVDPPNQGWWFGGGEDRLTRTIYHKFAMDGPRADLYSARHHAAFVRDGEEVRLYVDGQPKRSGGAIVDDSIPPDPSVHPSEVERYFLGASVGRSGKTLSRFLRGALDEFRLSKTARYSQAFTPDQQFPADDATLVLYHFLEGTGDVLEDSSGRERHGKIVDAKWIKADD